MTTEQRLNLALAHEMRLPEDAIWHNDGEIYTNRFVKLTKQQKADALLFCKVWLADNDTKTYFVRLEDGRPVETSLTPKLCFVPTQSGLYTHYGMDVWGQVPMGAKGLTAIQVYQLTSHRKGMPTVIVDPHTAVALVGWREDA